MVGLEPLWELICGGSFSPIGSDLYIDGTFLSDLHTIGLQLNHRQFIYEILGSTSDDPTIHDPDMCLGRSPDIRLGRKPDIL